LAFGILRGKKTSDGFDELNLATILGQKTIANLLITHGDKPTLFYIASFGSLQDMEIHTKSNNQLLSIRDSTDNNLLHYAAKFGSTAMVSYLVDKNVSRTQRNKHLNLPLHCAAASGRSENIQPLTGPGCIDARNYLQRTPLHEAVYHNDIACAKMLLELGASTHITDDAGKTPLQIATDAGALQMSQLLVAFGAGK
jgi:ankyrin repeat protein